MSTVPHAEISAEASDSYEALSIMLTSTQSVSLAAGDGSSVELPEEIRSLLGQVIDAHLRDEQVSLHRTSEFLTTSEAAAQLGVSRPTLVSYLNRGELPFEMRGRHRRVKQSDVDEFRERTRLKRRRILDELNQESDDYRGEADETFIRTR